jgi:predicted metal-dependent hydrolase
MTMQLAFEFSGWHLRERISPRARRIRIEIRGSDEVLLVIPRWASRRSAYRFLESRADWIRHQLGRQRERQSRPLPAAPELTDTIPRLREKAREQANQLIAAEAARMGVQPGRLRIADQKTLWGSCGGSGTISLNWRLVLAPAEVFRYVVIHELAHLVHRNHSRRFWSLVERQMPDYAPARRWLRDHGARLHAVVT